MEIYNCNMCINYNSNSYTVNQRNNTNNNLENIIGNNYSNSSSAENITAYAASTGNLSSGNYNDAGNSGFDYSQLSSIVLAARTGYANNNDAVFFDIKGFYEGIPLGPIHYPATGQLQHYQMQQSQSQNVHTGYAVIDLFLNEQRPMTQFIDEVEQIKTYIQNAFEKTTGYELPADISIKLCDAEELKKIHESFGGKWENSIQGFSINKTRQIFVKKSDLDKVMLVIGHEIGHVLSQVLPNKQDEEAKAFAFEMAWMKTIVEQNIANLKENIAIDFAPAQNGLHDISFNFVKKIVTAGRKALEIYKELMYGILEVKEV